MARLSTFHMLCPLIDQSSFLGVSNDSSKDCVIVTLGRNIVMRYKIIDRKQVGSWSTRDKLTSPVIYDQIGCQYVAVFNRSQIRTWKQDDEDLDRVKKYKFSEEIQCVLVCPGINVEPVVLLQSGRVCWLSRFMQCKEKILDVWSQQESSGLKTVLKSGVYLEDWHLISCQAETYILLSARSSTSSKQLSFYLLFLSSKIGEEYTVLKRFSLKLPDAQLVCHTVIQQNDNSSILTLWSNGKIYSLSLSMLNKSHRGEDPDQSISEKSREEECVESPGRLVDSVKCLLNVENAVTMVALGPDHIALYGAESGLTGGVVYIVDIHSSVTGDLPWEALKESAAKQSLKQFDTKEMPPRIWNAAEYLFIPSSDGRLVLASYELGPQPPLSDLLGCLWKLSKNKKAINNNNNGIVNHHSQLECVNWLNSVKPAVQNKRISSKNGKVKPIEEGHVIFKKDEAPKNVCLKLQPLIKLGLPESSICSVILPSLMEEGDVESISWCISHFRDIPEANLVDLLCFFLNQKPVNTTTKREESKSKPSTDIASASPCEISHVVPTSPKVSKEKQLQDDVESVKVVMNGDVHEPMDTDTCDSHVEDSEVEGFEVGHIFVKGRRRSLRMMQGATPNKESSTPKVVGSTKKVTKMEKVCSEDVSLMDAESCTTPVKCTIKKGGRRNSSLVLNGLGVVKEGVEVDRCSESGLHCITEGNAVVDAKCEEGGGVGRTITGEVLEKHVERPSLVIEEEKKIGSLALPHEQHRQVRKILSVPVSSVILIPQLRLRLPFPLALKLLKHLLWLLSSPTAPEPSSLTDIQVVEWICHLLDAFYQRFTLSQDDEVKDTLAAIKEVLDMELQLIDALKEIAPIVVQLKSGKKAEENTCDKWYSIENIRLY